MGKNKGRVSVYAKKLSKTNIASVFVSYSGLILFNISLFLLFLLLLFFKDKIE